MQSTGARIALAIGALAVIVVLFVLLQSNDDSGDGTTTTTPTTTATTKTKPAKPKTTTISLDENGKPVGGTKRLSFDSGERVRFAVRSRVDDDIHVHGYDIEKSVPASETVVFSFPARLEGVFEVEGHVSGQQVAELSVKPR